MKKIGRKHIAAIEHGKLFLTKALSTNPEPRFKKQIEEDLTLLDEVVSRLLYQFYHPELPFDIKETNNGTKTT